MSIQDLSDEELQRLAGIQNLSDEELSAMAENPMEVPGVGQSMLIGAGKTLTDLGRGAQKLYYGATGNEEELSNLSDRASREQGFYDELTQERPWATLGGEMLPYLATAPLSGGWLTQGAIGGVGEGLRYGTNQAGQGAMGMAMSMGGYGVGRAAPRVMGAIRGVAKSNKEAMRALTEGQKRLVNRADELGYQLTPGQRLQSKPLQQIERSAESMPFTSGLTEGMEKENQALLNRLALDSIGEVGEEVRGTHFARAADRIGKVYSDVAKDIPSINLNKQSLTNLVDGMSVEGESYIARYIKKYPSLADGKLTGSEFNKLSSKVEKDIRGAFTSNPAIADDLIDLKNHLHASLAKASPESKEALKVAGKQWKNLKALEQGNSVTKGNVNPRTLSSKLNRIDKGGFKRERNLSDYYDTLRIADEMGGTGANSQTATRSWLMEAASNPMAIPGGAAVRPVYNKYLQSGGSPVYANLLGAYPSAGRAGATGAGVARGLGSTEIPE